MDFDELYDEVQDAEIEDVLDEELIAGIKIRNLHKTFDYCNHTFEHLA